MYLFNTIGDSTMNRNIVASLNNRIASLESRLKRVAAKIDFRDPMLNPDLTHDDIYEDYAPGYSLDSKGWPDKIKDDEHQALRKFCLQVYGKIILSIDSGYYDREKGEVRLYDVHVKRGSKHPYSLHLHKYDDRLTFDNPKPAFYTKMIIRENHGSVELFGTVPPRVYSSHAADAEGIAVIERAQPTQVTFDMLDSKCRQASSFNFNQVVTKDEWNRLKNNPLYQEWFKAHDMLQWRYEPKTHKELYEEMHMKQKEYEEWYQDKYWGEGYDD